jgi:hypothetical protein
MQEKLHPSDKDERDVHAERAFKRSFKLWVWLDTSRTKVPVVLSLRIGRMDFTWVGEDEGEESTSGS